MYDKIDRLILDEITTFCGNECPNVTNCPEDECVLFRIENIVCSYSSHHRFECKNSTNKNITIKIYVEYEDGTTYISTMGIKGTDIKNQAENIANAIMLFCHYNNKQNIKEVLITNPNCSQDNILAYLQR